MFMMLMGLAMFVGGFFLPADKAINTIIIGVCIYGIVDRVQMLFK